MYIKYSKVTFLNPFYSPDFNCAMCLRSAAMFRVVLGVKEKVCGRSGKRVSLGCSMLSVCSPGRAAPPFTQHTQKADPARCARLPRSRKIIPS